MNRSHLYSHARKHANTQQNIIDLTSDDENNYYYIDNDPILKAVEEYSGKLKEQEARRKSTFQQLLRARMML